MYQKVLENGIAREILIKANEWELYIYYMQLLSYRNQKTYLCCPSYDTLMKDMGIKSMSTIADYNKRLKDLGLIYTAKYYDPKSKKDHIKYFFPKEQKQCDIDRILNCGTKDLRTIENKTGYTPDMLENLGFDVNRHNRKLLGLHQTEEPATNAPL